MPDSVAIKRIDRPKRAAGYLRTCAKEPVDTARYGRVRSIAAQRRICALQAAVLGCVMVAEFIDKGVPARSLNRSGLQRMLAYLEAEPVDVLIVQEPNRLTGNWLDGLALVNQLEQAGVCLVVCSGQLDHDAPTADIFLSQLLSKPLSDFV